MFECNNQELYCMVRTLLLSNRLIFYPFYLYWLLHNLERTTYQYIIGYVRRLTVTALYNNGSVLLRVCVSYAEPTFSAGRCIEFLIFWDTDDDFLIVTECPSSICTSKIKLINSPQILKNILDAAQKAIIERNETFTCFQPKPSH